MARLAAAGAVIRAVLIGRLVVLIATILASIRLVDDPHRPALALALVTGVTLAQLYVISRRPDILRRRLTVLAVEVIMTLSVLVVGGPGLAFFGHALGTCLIAGALLGVDGLLLCLAQAALGLGMVTQMSRSLGPDARSLLAPFLIAIPVADIVAGLAAGALTTGLTRYIELSVEVAQAAQRSAATSERARLARDLHDSVAKTLRGISFAAVALPSSLRRHPDLAEQLAATVVTGAETAQREARELLFALRRDVPDNPFVDTVRNVCADWTTTNRVPVSLDLAQVEPTLAARYELAQILSEALRNIAQHAGASRVRVELTDEGGWIRLSVHDDGVGFVLPHDLSQLAMRGSFGVVGMSERARTIGGRLTVTSSAGGGTTVAATTPSASHMEPEVVDR
ncbi:sensor histidine kinase [Micromonospora sp. CA-249363]|uniref:sensor histidine kinase n=1 Tax=Micromonospora sp. CA-249363 TaxID=3239963 RepID=UPI003D8C81B4